MSVPLERHRARAAAWLEESPMAHAFEPRAASTSHAASRAHDPLKYLGLADQAVLLLAGILCYQRLAHTAQMPWMLLVTMIIGMVMFALTGHGRRLYSYDRMKNSMRQCMPFAFAFFQFAVAVSAALFFCHTDFPKPSAGRCYGSPPACFAWVACGFCFGCAWIWRLAWRFTRAM